MAVDTTTKDKEELRREKAMREVEDQALKALEDLGGKAFREDRVIFEGDKLILPEDMSIRSARRYLRKLEEELETETSFSRQYAYRPWDVAWCSARILGRFFGAVAHVHGEVEFFGMKFPVPPEVRTIQIGPGEYASIPWGGFVLPFLPAVTFQMGSLENVEWGTIGVVTANGAKKYSHAVEGVFNLIHKELIESSLYKGKAFDARPDPQFIDLSHIRPERIIYAEETMAQFEANLWSPLQYMEANASLGLPFKRAVLVEGDFGTGKTLAINRTLQIATQNGITGILVRPGRDDLAQALMTARMYQPAIVAFEDVDTVADAEEDERRISQILDLFDGIEAKNNKVMLVLTTNHVEKLHKGMLRPGRLDAVIHVGSPDAAGIRKLIESQIPPERLAVDVDWERVAIAFDDYLPAFVVEGAQRSLRYALVRHKGDLMGDINTDDLVYAGEGLREQFDMMSGAKTGGEDRTLERALRDTMHDAQLEVLGVEQQLGETPLDALRRFYGVKNGAEAPVKATKK